MVQINDQSRLLQLDYRPLTDPVPKELLAAYQADHELSDRESPFGARQLLYGYHPWPRRFRLDNFARYNGLTYTPAIDPEPFTNIGFYDKRYIYARSVVDVLTTADGQVRVASFDGPSGPNSSARIKFAEIFLGHDTASFTLTPLVMTDSKAGNELERHFTFSDRGNRDLPLDTDAMRPLMMPEIAARLSPEDRARLPLDVQWAAEQEAKKGWFARWRDHGRRRKQLVAMVEQGRHDLVGRLFDPTLQQLIVEEALGFTVEIHKAKLYVYQQFSSEDALVKPELLQRMFRIAALIGTGISQATRKH